MSSKHTGHSDNILIELAIISPLMLTFFSFFFLYVFISEKPTRSIFFLAPTGVKGVRMSVREYYVDLQLLAKILGQTSISGHHEVFALPHPNSYLQKGTPSKTRRSILGSVSPTKLG